MGIFKLRIELRALWAAVEELRRSIDNHSEAIHATEKTKQDSNVIRKPMPVVVSPDEETKKDTKEDSGRHYGIQKSIRNWAAFAAIAAVIYGLIAIFQWSVMQGQLRLQKRVAASQVQVVWSRATFSTTKDQKVLAVVRFVNGGLIAPDSISYGITAGFQRPSKRQFIFKNPAPENREELLPISIDKNAGMYIQSEGVSYEGQHPTGIYVWGIINYSVFDQQVHVPFCRATSAEQVISSVKQNKYGGYDYDQSNPCPTP